ncbi:hypothetical protein VTN96DRAFT_8509 [Rasamsonia emersonii]
MDEGKGGAAAAADAERGRGHQARGFYGLPISFSGQFKALGENAANPPFRSGGLRCLPQRTAGPRHCEYPEIVADDPIREFASWIYNNG